MQIMISIFLTKECKICNVNFWIFKLLANVAEI